MYEMVCGCEFTAYVRVWSCECCGTDYELEDAEITQACETHGG